MCCSDCINAKLIFNICFLSVYVCLCVRLCYLYYKGVSLPMFLSDCFHIFSLSTVCILAHQMVSQLQKVFKYLVFCIEIHI